MAFGAEDDGTVIGFMCLTDWEYELGMAADGNKIYPSINSLKEQRPCVEECGIAKVRVSLEKVVQESNYEC